MKQETHNFEFCDYENKGIYKLTNKNRDLNKKTE